MDAFDIKEIRKLARLENIILTFEHKYAYRAGEVEECEIHRQQM